MFPDITISAEEAQLYFKTFWQIVGIMTEFGGLILDIGSEFGGIVVGAIGAFLKFVGVGEVPEEDLLDVKLKF